MKLDFMAKQSSGNTRLCAAYKKYNNRSIHFKKSYRMIHKEIKVFMKSNSVEDIFLS